MGVQTVHANKRREHNCAAGYADEGEIGFFKEVLEIHAVETCEEGAGAETEGSDGEFEVEEHEGIAIRVEDDIDAG